MATLNMNSSLQELVTFLDQGSVTEDIDLAYSAVNQAVDTALTALDPGVETGTLNPEGTAYDWTLSTTDPTGPVLNISLTGSGFSLSPDPAEAALGIIDISDTEFTINSLDLSLTGSSAGGSELANLAFQGALVVSGGELVSGQLTTLSATADNGAETTFTGAMAYNGVSLTGNNVSIAVEADMNPAAGAPVLGNLSVVADLNVNFVTDANTSIIKSMYLDDAYHGHHMELTGMTLGWADMEAATDMADIINRAGQSGGNDTANVSASFVLPASFEKLTLTGTGNIDGTGNGLANTLTGNGGANLLSGLAGNDRLVGNAGNDNLDGGTGVDTMLGGAGNDTYQVDNAGDVVTELAAQGTDTVRAGVTYTLKANAENLVLTGALNRNGTGNALNNTLTGNGAANQLSGLAGKDKLLGGGGNDILVGGLGDDTLTGGLGGDRFRFVLAGEGTDSITDFTRAQGDKLVFVSPNFGNLTPAALAAARFRANATGSALDADDRFLFNTTSKVLSFDADGSGAGAAVQIAKLTNGVNLVAGDILITAS